ncbi:hypothetical protein ES705_32516 [subsurface metagenome]
MPKISGYPQARDVILTYIAEHQPTELDRAKTASMLKSSISTAGNYLTVLANEFPESLKYVRGMLLIFSLIPEENLPLTVKMSVKDKKITEVKSMVDTLEKNHLNHFDKKAIIKQVKLIKKELDLL